MNTSATPRILITRLSAIGDCILTLPLARALRAAYPHSFLAWVCEAGSAPLVRRQPDLDQVFVVRKGWLRSPRQTLALRRQLRDGRFDWVIDPQSLTKSAVAGWLTGARQRIGFASPQGREVAPWLHSMSVRRTAVHGVDAYLELLAPLGIRSPVVEFRLSLADAEQQAADRIVAATGLDRFAVLNPGAGWDSKLWPAECYAELAHRLAATAGVRSLVVWAGARERAWAEQIVAAAPGAAQLAPATSLLELAALCRRADLFVGSDTGPLHLAAAVGTTCVGLYGPTSPAECGPYGAGHVTVQAYLQTGNSRERRGADNHAMRGITVQSVLQACERASGRRAAAGDQRVA